MKNEEYHNILYELSVIFSYKIWFDKKIKEIHSKHPNYLAILNSLNRIRYNLFKYNIDETIIESAKLIKEHDIDPYKYQLKHLSKAPKTYEALCATTPALRALIKEITARYGITLNKQKDMEGGLQEARKFIDSIEL